LGRKIKLTGISPAKCSRSGPNSVYVDKSKGDNVQVILVAIGQFWAKWGLGRVPRARVFLCGKPTTFWQLRNSQFSPNLFMKRTSVFHRKIRKIFFEKFHFRGHLPPKSEIKNRSKQEPHSEQAMGCTAERYFTPRCSPMAKESPRSVNFSLRSTVAQLRGIKIAQFSDFGLISPYKTPKTYLPVTSLQPRGYIAE